MPFKKIKIIGMVGTMLVWSVRYVTVCRDRYVRHGRGGGVVWWWLNGRA